MNLLADEITDNIIAERLRWDDYSVLCVADLHPSIDDDFVLHQANWDGALLIMADNDFGELVFRVGWIHTGVVLIRLTRLSLENEGKDRIHGICHARPRTDFGIQCRFIRKSADSPP